MQPKRVIVAVVLAVVGLVWVAQGLGYLGGSTMTGDRTWALIGAVLLVVAGGLAWSGRGRSRRPPPVVEPRRGPPRP